MKKFIFLFLLISFSSQANNLCFQMEHQIKEDMNYVIGQAWLRNPDDYMFHNSIKVQLDNLTYITLNRMHEKARTQKDCSQEYYQIQTILKNMMNVIQGVN
jgi:hypothetical protein